MDQKLREQFYGEVTFSPYNQQVYRGDWTETGPGPSDPRYLLATIQDRDQDGNKTWTEKAISHALQATMDQVLQRPANYPLQAAPEGQGNSQNLTHLQLIKLFPQIQGLPTRYFYMDSAFVSKPIPILEFRESWTSVDAQVQRLERMEETQRVQNLYSEIKYNLPKLSGKVYTPIEDVYRTIINPMAIDWNNLRFAFEYWRNRLAIEAIQKIKWGPRGVENGATSAEGSGPGHEIVPLGELNKTADRNFHSEEHVGTKLNDAMIDFLNHNDCPINMVVMSTKAYARWNENTWMRMGGPTGLMPLRLAQGAVVPLPGFEGITCVIDPMLDRDVSSTSTGAIGRIYCLNKENALRLGEGPKLMRRYRDEERDADALKILDFVQYLSVDHELSTYQPEGYTAADYSHSRLGNRFFSFACSFEYTS